MLKFKRRLVPYIVFYIGTILYYLIICNTNRSNIPEGTNLLFSDYTYIVVLSILLFKELWQSMSDMILCPKFKDVTQFVRFKFVDTSKRMFLPLLLYTCLLIGLESLVDIDRLFFLCYRLFVLYVILLMFYLVIISSRKKNLKRNIIIGLFIWNILFISMILFGISNPINSFNPFFLCYTMDGMAILRFLVLSAGIISFLFYRIQTKGALLINDEI